MANPTITVTREDNGVAEYKFSDGSTTITGKGFWDDATPWASNSYKASYWLFGRSFSSFRFGTPTNPDPIPNRKSIVFHLGTDTGNTEGCLVDADDFVGKVTPGEMPWWGDENKAIDFASQVFDQLLEGTTPGNSPLFAYEVIGSDVNGWSSDILNPNSLYFETFGTVATVKYAVAKEVSAVPGPLPILGIYTAFTFTRRLRRRLRSVTVSKKCSL